MRTSAPQVTRARRGREMPQQTGYIGAASRSDAKQSGRRWFPYAKGGEFRRWYGNSESVVDWSNDGHALQTTLHPDGGRIWAHNFNLGQVFRPAICWTVVTIGETGFRYHPAGYIFDAAAGLCQAKEPTDNLFVLGALNSRVATNALKLINPTVNLHPGYLGRVPLPNRQMAGVRQVVEGCLSLARHDWDNFETSWDFRDHPLLRPGTKTATLAATWRNWESSCTAAIRRMQELETENNRLFIAAYGLEGELQPEVPEDQITLARADVRRDVAAFLSYAVGCMMGRYSLDHPGLVLADAGDTLREYLAKVGRLKEQLTFAPDEDGILPVLDGEWFADDIVARTRDFLRATFGEATLRENLRFIEESLGKDLRKYFLTDFYKDHLKTYKKRPIYWMVQSPKRGFAVLIYLHRYTRDSLNLVLNRYLREYQAKVATRIAALAQAHASATSAAAKTEARKESEKLTKVLLECQEWERQALLPFAQARVELDLDDGVKVNYLKLSEVLAPIPGLAAADE